MGFGIPEEVAALWQEYDPDSYEAFHLWDSDGICWFEMLPDWAYTTDGPFMYIEQDSSLVNTNLRPSWDGYYLGTVSFE